MPQKIEDKRRRAEANAAERAGRTNRQQIERLDFMLGKGNGAKKERARLLALIEEEKSGKKDKIIQEVIETIKETPEELAARRAERKAAKKAAKKARKEEQEG